MIEDVDFVSSYAVRCPKCGNVWEPDEYIYPCLLIEGDNYVWCRECGCDFPVHTKLSYTFSSPVMDSGKEE